MCDKLHIRKYTSHIPNNALEIINTSLYRHKTKKLDYREVYYGFYLNSKFVGCAVLAENFIYFAEDEEDATPHYMNIFVLDNQYRGKGHGTIFFEKLRKIYNCFYLKAISQDSERFWARQGFHPILGSENTHTCNWMSNCNWKINEDK